MKANEEKSKKWRIINNRRENQWSEMNEMAGGEIEEMKWNEAKYGEMKRKPWRKNESRRK